MRRFVAALLGALPLAAGAEALEWLQRMNEAVRQTTYEGVAVYRSGHQLETLRVFHQYAGGEERERIYSLSGQPREVLRHAEEVTCILPDQKVVLVDHQGLRGLLPKLPRTAFERLRSHYEMSELPHSSRIAGRSCTGIRIASRDQYRYSYEIWLDKETALPLDIKLLGEDGSLLEQVVFTQIGYPESLSDEQFTPEVDVSDFQRVQQTVSDRAIQDDQPLWELAEMPAGFRLATRELQRLPGVAQPVTLLHYTDGLAAVSVFTAPQTLPEQALEGLTRFGGVNAYGRMLDQYHITVVGEVPQATVRHFGDNLRRVSGQQVSQ